MKSRAIATPNSIYQRFFNQLAGGMGSSDGNGGERNLAPAKYDDGDDVAVGRGSDRGFEYKCREPLLCDGGVVGAWILESQSEVFSGSWSPTPDVCWPRVLSLKLPLSPWPPRC